MTEERVLSHLATLVSTIKFGSTGLHTPEQLKDNLLVLIPQLAVKIPESDFGNIQSMHIKSSTSTSLPIYNQSLDDEGVFKGPSEEELRVIAEKKVEKERKQKERDERRKERSATKEGKGRAEKKRKAGGAASEDGEGEGSVVVEETELALTKPIVAEEEDGTASAPAPAKKKAKKTKKSA